MMPATDPSLSPFDFGNTVSTSLFTDREDELRRLKMNMASGINTIVISPRRWGKSSLVEQAAIELQKERKTARVVVLDMFTCNTFEEFLETLSREVVRAGSNKWEEQVQNAKTFLKAITPRISIGTEMEGELALGFDWKEAKKHVGHILDLPERLAKAKKLRLVICLDEFQNLDVWGEDLKLQKLMRAHWQRQKNVTYVLYGSKRHMMASLFDDSGSPFYRFGDIIWLQKIPVEKWIAFITGRFKSTGRSISDELAAALARTMGCHSWYVQQLAHFTWANTRRKADRNALEQALRLVIDTNVPLYQFMCETLSNTAINVLKAIASGEHQLTSAEVMTNYRLGTPRNVTKTRNSLEGKDIIERTRKGYAFLDPGFELWFKREFLGRPVKIAEV
jgi:uncharacterized protein